MWKNEWFWLKILKKVLKIELCNNGWKFMMDFYFCIKVLLKFFFENEESDDK